MPYVEGQTVHDADSHVMELPDAILQYVEPRLRKPFAEKTATKTAEAEWAQKARHLHDDPEFRAAQEPSGAGVLPKPGPAQGARPAGLHQPTGLHHLGAGKLRPRRERRR